MLHTSFGVISPLASSTLQALDTRYFRSHPVCPENISELPPLELPDSGGSYHEFQTKRKRKEDGVMQQDAKRAQKKKVPWPHRVARSAHSNK